VITTTIVAAATMIAIAIATTIAIAAIAANVSSLNAPLAANPFISTKTTLKILTNWNAPLAVRFLTLLKSATLKKTKQTLNKFRTKQRYGRRNLPYLFEGKQ
jgi:hypothetical protein